VKLERSPSARAELVIPASRESDGEDVLWALETAEALFRRHERPEAIAWLRRAAEAAGLAGDDDRALELARAAADLADDTPQTRSDIRALGRPEPTPFAFDDDEEPTRPATGRVAAILDAVAVPTSDRDARHHSAARITSPDLDVDLDAVPELSDLPDEARKAFGRAALTTVHRAGAVASGFALGLVVSGAFEMTPLVQPAPAARLGAGTILRARASRGAIVPFRLICRSEGAVLATWGELAVKAALHTAPWVEDDLRAAADRYHAAAGAMSGLVGAALEPELRIELTSRAVTRALLPGEELVVTGAPVPGAVLVGAGVLRGDAARDLPPGALVYGPECLSGSPASFTTRAGPDGALVLVLARHLAQEIGTRCPPFLALLAG